MKLNHSDAERIGEILRKTEPTKTINFGGFQLHVDHRPLEQSNDWDKLEGKHRYAFPSIMKNFNFSLNLYLNTTSNGNQQYRLAVHHDNDGKNSGLIMTINLTLEKQLDGVINLSTKIKFNSHISKNVKGLGDVYKRSKQVYLSSILAEAGFEVTDNFDVVFGLYNPAEEFLNTNPESLVHDILLYSLLKGHFMETKRYSLKIYPSIIQTGTIDESISEELILPQKLIKPKSSRYISLGIRYKILKRDNFSCKNCGKKASDGVKLHIDHVHPISLGGSNNESNLQVLCEFCNLGKSNKY